MDDLSNTLFQEMLQEIADIPDISTRRFDLIIRKYYENWKSKKEEGNTLFLTMTISLFGHPDRPLKYRGVIQKFKAELIERGEL